MTICHHIAVMQQPVAVRCGMHGRHFRYIAASKAKAPAPTNATVPATKSVSRTARPENTTSNGRQTSAILFISSSPLSQNSPSVTDVQCSNKPLQVQSYVRVA